MGKEVRKVPADWQHPVDEDGDYIPLCYATKADFEVLVADWKLEESMWNDGFTNYQNKDEWVQKDKEDEGMPFKEWNGICPSEADYMPLWTPEQTTHYMMYVMYENTNKGTPISPAFETPEELANWLIEEDE